MADLATGTLAMSPADTRWMEFVGAHPSANIFHHPAWVQFVADCYGYRPFVLVTQDFSGRIVGGVPFIEIDRLLGGKRLVALPFTDHCAPLYSEDSCGLFVQSIRWLSSEIAPSELELRWHVPALTSAQIVSAYVLHTLPLEVDAKRVLDRFHSAHRRNIRTAQKSGLRVERGSSSNELRQFYRLHLETRRRQGVPVQPWRFFELLGERLLKPGLGFVLLAYKNDECVASSIFLHWRNTLMYKYGASTESALPCRPNNLLMWTAIQWGCENGFSQFDFGRTDLQNAGLRRFKAGFGARELPLTYSLLSKRPATVATGRLMDIVRFVIRNSPTWVCQATGQTLYKHFG